MTMKCCACTVYGIEKDCKDANAPERFLARQQQSLPVLTELREWLNKTQPTVVLGSALGRAIAYMHD
jgi:hypothetical protein